jgi:hypothetical protein
VTALIIALIYALIDPITKKIRYIGKSERGLERPPEHWAASHLAKDNTHKGRWIKQVIRNGYIPDVAILEIVDDLSRINIIEDEWINFGRRKGWPLTNARINCAEPLDTFIAKKLIATKAQISPRRGFKDSIETRRRKSEAAKVRSIITLADLGKWSRAYDACIKCNKTEFYHKGNGLCYRCHNQAKTTKPALSKSAVPRVDVFDRPKFKPVRATWNSVYSSCLSCGLTDHPHKGKGQCLKCYEHTRALRRRDNNRVIKGIIPGRWSRVYDACTVCHQTNNKHVAHGRCDVCYLAEYRSAHPFVKR